MPKGIPARLSGLPDYLTNRQSSILNGCLLGDGGITKPQCRPYKETRRFGQCNFTETHESKCLSYVQWLYKELEPFSKTIQHYTRPGRKKLANGKVVNDYTKICSGDELRTVRVSLFSRLRELWYPEGKKIVPESILLDPLTIAVWAAGDGSNCQDEGKFRFCTEGFARCEVDMLCEKLNEFGEFRVYKHKGGWIISTVATSYQDFMLFLQKHMPWDCFRYKCDSSNYVCPQYRITRLSEEQIRNVFTLKKQGMLQRRIADKLGMSQQHVSQVLLLRYPLYRRISKEMP